MKLILYILAVAAIVAAGFFSWQVKEKYAAKISARDEIKGKNKVLSQNIIDKQDEKKVAEADKQAAIDQKAEVFAQHDSSQAQGKQLGRDLEVEQERFTAAKARQDEITKIMTEIKELFPDTEIEDVPRVFEDLQATKRKLDKEYEEQEIVKDGLIKEVGKNNDEINRVGSKIAESRTRVLRNDFQATVTSVSSEWDFLVIAAGEKSGLAGDSRLLVQRGGRLLGKVAISSLEANQAVAEIVPGSLAPGAVIQPGDQVILEKVKSN